ncbi:MAG TPA: cell wall hydrolase [Xanthomonadaceae bacterium]|jgi:spore germination cell wall hydrolase CwlJ-like protein|nr:cell wall hydrolase [Xanthomonadaceae bacterium]
MELSFLMWLASLLPPAQAEPLCLATTVYLEARDQSELGQRAVAEVALRRRDSGAWGDDVCAVVNAPKQFAPTLVPPSTRLRDPQAWERAVAVAFDAKKEWSRPRAERREVVPGASHFAALRLASPNWASYPQVAVIDDHTFFRVKRLTPRPPPATAGASEGGSR